MFRIKFMPKTIEYCGTTAKQPKHHRIRQTHQSKIEKSKTFHFILLLRLFAKIKYYYRKCEQKLRHNERVSRQASEQTNEQIKQTASAYVLLLLSLCSVCLRVFVYYSSVRAQVLGANGNINVVRGVANDREKDFCI